MDGWNTTFLLGRPIFRSYVSFREGKCHPDKLVYHACELKEPQDHTGTARALIFVQHMSLETKYMVITVSYQLPQN